MMYEHSDEDESQSVLPLIDVLLITLVFFLATSFSHGQINLPLPPSPHPDPSSATQPPVTLEIDVQGTTKLDGNIYEAAALQQKLEQLKPSGVLLVAHREAPIKYLINARDVLVRARITKIDVATANASK
jgi:biopolymer transport protein ExbD